MGPSSLISPSTIVVADTSTAINLNATGYAVQILNALPNRVHMTDIAIAELGLDKRNGRQDAKLAAELVKNSFVVALSLGSVGLGHFESLVVGCGKDTLDDGEASTIALSVELNGVPVMDERKAMRICRERYTQLSIGCTMDILSHEAVCASLGQKALETAVFNALQDARMRVLPHYTDWIVTLIGHERAASCPSLRQIVR